MSIPLDRLYHFINDTAGNIYGDLVIIYRFWPHGSKNINDLNNLYAESDWVDKITSPIVWCNDQEPLDYKFYKTHLRQYSSTHNSVSTLLNSLGLLQPITNLNYLKNMFEKALLLHSETRSSDLEKYQDDDELIPVYYWSHGIISQDWFRYAKYEKFQKDIKKTFLIYNRAWSGTREYRLFFSDLLIKHGLIDQCQTNCNPIDPELNVHYSQHKFNNPQWQPTNILEKFLQPTTADSNSSADFNTNDYNSTNIEVVLETLFDDGRLHLTEKSLRPIACNQPFILAATHGSLDYLRSYGFKTFDSVWNESYDQIIDPEDRLTAIACLMHEISMWDEETKKNKLVQAQEIADYNQQWFFSTDFFNLLVNELKTNLELAFDKLNNCNNYQRWIDRWTYFLSLPEVNEYLKTNQTHTPSADTIDFVMKLAKHKLTQNNS